MPPEYENTSGHLHVNMSDDLATTRLTKKKIQEIIEEAEAEARKELEALAKEIDKNSVPPEVEAEFTQPLEGPPEGLSNSQMNAAFPRRNK